MKKTFIQADQLLEDSFKLAWNIFESGYRPNYIVGVWRGGAPVGIAVQEFLEVLGISSDHIAIRTSHYSGIDKHNENVKVYGLNYVIKKLESEDSLLIVDDVHDTGLSIQQIISDLKAACKKNTPEIKVATPYFKPSKNKTKRKFLPNLQNVKFFSKSLDKFISMKVSVRALKSVEKNGGLDDYLSKTSNRVLAPQAIAIKKSIQKNLKKEVSSS